MFGAVRYAVDDGPIGLWIPGDRVPAEFIEAAENPKWLVSAFNDSFERAIEQHIMGPRYGWPLTPIERHQCLQAAALALALPASLEGAARALGLEQQKDAAGRNPMLRMAKPRKPRRDEDPAGVYWFDDADRRETLGAYCRQDVATERALHQRIGVLHPTEHDLWVLDATINARGIHLDTSLLTAAINIADAAQTSITEEIARITAGEVRSIDQVAALLAWLRANGCEVPDVRKTTLEKALHARGPISHRPARDHVAARWCACGGEQALDHAGVVQRR